MEQTIDRYAWHCEDCTGIPDVAHGLGPRVANATW